MTTSCEDNTGMMLLSSFSSKLLSLSCNHWCWYHCHCVVGWTGVSRLVQTDLLPLLYTPGLYNCTLDCTLLGSHPLLALSGMRMSIVGKSRLSLQSRKCYMTWGCNNIIEGLKLFTSLKCELLLLIVDNSAKILNRDLETCWWSCPLLLSGRIKLI